MMAAAAAALSRSRGVVGVRGTKGLFFIFTLLCLVCLASSLTDKDQLENLKACFKKAQQNMDEWKKETIQVRSNKSKQALPPSFKQNSAERAITSELMSKFERLREKIAESDVQMEIAEYKLEQMKKFIQFLEERQAEL